MIDRRTYGDCRIAMRGTPSNPCAFEACRYHLMSDNKEDRHRSLPVLSDSSYTCALAFIDRGGPVDEHGSGSPATADEIAACLGVTRTRVQQIEASARRKVGSMLGHDGDVRSGVTEDDIERLATAARATRPFRGNSRSFDSARASAAAALSRRREPATDGGLRFHSEDGKGGGENFSLRVEDRVGQPNAGPLFQLRRARRSPASPLATAADVRAALNCVRGNNGKAPRY